jgi:hypothetical protein
MLGKTAIYFEMTETDDDAVSRTYTLMIPNPKRMGVIARWLWRRLGCEIVGRLATRDEMQAKADGCDIFVNSSTEVE